MKAMLSITINGDEFDLAFDSRDTLLDLLRERAGLKGTKEGCGNGNCGACTVLLNGMAVNSCIVLAAEAAGSDVVTIEGIAARGSLHAVQKALIEVGGTQCGFCTPGIVISAKALLDRDPHPTEEAIRHAIAGNLCRCTGYDKIVQAIALATQSGEA